MGLGRLLYAARVMDGESVPLWLNFGAGKGLLCSPRLSWVSRFAAARLLLGCRAARGSPSRCAPTERQGCPAKATSTQPEAGGALVLRLATENKLRLCKAGPWPLPGERAGGPHITVLQRPGPHISWVKNGVRDLGPSATTFSLLSWGQVLQQGQCPAQL